MGTLESLKNTVNGNTLALFEARLAELINSGVSEELVVQKLWVTYRCFRYKHLERIVSEAIENQQNNGK